jgi:hypothetical protein
MAMKQARFLGSHQNNNLMNHIYRRKRGTKNQQGNFRIKWHYESNGFNRHLQNIPPKSHRISIVLITQRMFPKTDHILGYKSSFDNYKKTEITSYILSDHNGIQLENNSKRNYRIYSNV